jgi:hypothetical protein
MLYSMHTNSKPAVGKEGKRIMRAAQSGKPISNKAASATVSTILARRSLKKADASKTEVQ